MIGRPYYLALRWGFELNKSKIELFLSDQRVAGDIERAEVILDFVQHIAFGPSQGPGDLWIHPQHCLAASFLATFARQPPRLFQNLVTDSLGRFHQARPLTVLAGC